MEKGTQQGLYDSTVFGRHDCVNPTGTKLAILGVCIFNLYGEGYNLKTEVLGYLI